MRKTKKSKIGSTIVSILLAAVAVVLGNAASLIVIDILNNIFVDMYSGYPNEDSTILIVLINLIMFVICAIITYGIIIRKKKRK